MKQEPITIEDLKEFFSKIVRIRTIEKAIAERYQAQEMKCPMHLSIGQEGPAVAISMQLNASDKMLSTHRSHAHYLAKGGNLNMMISEFFGRETGCSGGMGGSMHLIDKSCGFEGATAIVGNTIPIAAGVALSQKLSRSKNITVVCFGEGATEEGVFSETLNIASVKNLPLIFFVENNGYSVYSPLSPRQSSNRHITKISEAHGIKSLKGNGNNIEEALAISSEAVKYVREKRKPCLIELGTYRYLEHCGPNNDDHIGYRTKKEIDLWKSYDVISNAKKVIKELGVSPDSLEKLIQENTKEEIDNAFREATLAPFPKIERSISYEYA